MQDLEGLTASRTTTAREIRPVVESLFKEKHQWRRRDLVRSVGIFHKGKGVSLEGKELLSAVRGALEAMEKENAILSVAFATYRIIGDDVSFDPQKPLLGIPLFSSNAKKIIIEVLRKNGAMLRKDIRREVERIHFSRGGVPGEQDAYYVTKKALSRLRKDGVIESADFATWKLISNESQADFPSEPATPPLDLSTPSSADFEIKKTIGFGSESVYVYFNPNEKRLAEIEHRDFWECKIGRTGTDVSRRIYDQSVKTAFARRPVVGLDIKTDDSRFIESAIKISLRGQSVVRSEDLEQSGL